MKNAKTCKIEYIPFSISNIPILFNDYLRVLIGIPDVGKRKYATIQTSQNMHRFSLALMKIDKQYSSLSGVTNFDDGR